MMPIVAVIEGGCPGCCTDDPCTPDITPYLAGGHYDYADEWDVTGQAMNGMTLYLFLRAQTTPDEVIFYADGVEFFTTGCLSGDSDHVINVPPGTKHLAMYLDNQCGGDSTFWLITLTCENVSP